MNLALLVAPLLLQTGATDSTRVCVIDAVTRLPIAGASVSATDREDAPRRMQTPCTRLADGAWLIRRVGYRMQRVVVSARRDSAQTVALSPLGWSVLDTMRVQAQGMPPSPSRISETLVADDARRAGAASTAALVDRLPFTQVRSARGASTVSLRGARREQVVVTLDGLPLNDPSTGVADLSDIPLVALGSASVTLGADPLGAGPGASGGVLSLSTAADRLLAVRAGALGQRSLEGAWNGLVGPTLARVSARHGVAQNDFLFDNDAGVSPVRERRINNDESRTAATVALTGTRWQVAGLASRADRGMVGAANVRTYDADRSRVDRVLLRAQADWSGMQLIGGYRRFALDYRDPNRPVLDAAARVHVADVAAQGSVQAPRVLGAAVAWKIGGGSDQVHASGGVSQARGRGFASAQPHWQAAGVTSALGVRVDAIGGAGTTPSWTISAERAVKRTLRLAARASQSVRAPTLYDLYFSAPQRLSVATLRPERVRADLELSAHLDRHSPLGTLTADVAAVSRDTRDAIVWFPGNFGWSPANVGREALRGVEARLRLRPSWGFASVWTTWYDAQVITGALRIPTPYVPRVASGAEWSITHRGVNAAVLARTLGRRPFTAGPRNPDFELPAVALVDVGVTHDLPQRVSARRVDASVTWSLDNATNVAWQSVRGFPSPGRTWALAFTLRHHPQS